MRFKIYENLPVEVVDVLTTGGHDALSVVDQGMRGTADPDVVAVCISEDRCLVTLDTDFSGIIVFRLAQQDKRSVVAVSSRLVAALESQAPDGALWVVDEQRIRVREGT